MPFSVVASGIEIEESKRTGNADQARRTLELIANISKDRTIIGLFDNDAEGNTCFRGLRKDVFDPYRVDVELRKHKSKNIYGMLLPVPEGRELFVDSTDITQRYLAIEHYFSDDILEAFNLKGGSILGTKVFKIKGNKDGFAERLSSLDSDCFIRFKTVFDKIMSLLD
jgi:hypothetical protein